MKEKLHKALLLSYQNKMNCELTPDQSKELLDMKINMLFLEANILEMKLIEADERNCMIPLLQVKEVLENANTKTPRMNESLKIINQFLSEEE